MSDNFKKESRSDWFQPEGKPNNDQLKLGCLQRIADAVEKMSASYASLIDERDRYKRWCDESKEMVKRTVATNSTLRGHITRLKRKLSQ